MKNRTSNEHLSAELLQAFLEGDLPYRETVGVEEHLAGCARCSAELDGWRVLFDDLGGLAPHRPVDGFADLVIAGVQTAPPGKHVATDVLQDFIEGSLAARKSARIEAHLEQCGACTAEADAWIAVMARLDSLESYPPSPGFSERVLAGVEIRASEPLAARVRSRVTAVLGLSRPEHVPLGILQDFVEGALPTRAVARVDAHLDACTTCAGEAAEWGLVMARLGTLGRYSPDEGFAERVLSAVRAAEAKSVARAPAWSRALTAAWRLVPQTRQAWAALSGVAVTPAVVAGLVFYAMFSHPTLTVGSLASFAWWQIADLASAMMNGLVTAAQSAEVLGPSTILEALSAAPMVIAGGVLGYSLVCALALRVLYRQLFAHRPSNGRYAHVPATS